MASEIKVDNIKDQCGTAVITKCGATHTVTAEVYKADTIQDTSGNAYLAKCGTTVTLGASGDTIQLACGASQTGFGRTGTVNWDTTKITADPANAVSGTGYFTDTSSAAFNVTLPSSPSAGDIVAVADYANTWDTNNLTIVRNGSNIEGEAENFVCNIEGSSITFVYVDATKGWIIVNSGNSSQAFNNDYIVATGGTITECGDFKIHTFTGPGTFSVTNAGTPAGSDSVDYLVVAGGGGGGTAFSISPCTGNASGAGAGAGGFRESHVVATSGCYTASPLASSTSIPVAVSAYPITVGAGGAAPTATTNPGDEAGDGSNSVFSTITSTGGGRGGANKKNGGTGGSGGGRGGESNPGPGAAGNSPPVSPPQGNPGGSGGFTAPNYGAGGGGGATAAGGNGSTTVSGNGGAGATTSISGSPTAYAGGGGASVYGSPSQTSGGTGGGGAGGKRSPQIAAGAGTTNTGGGGGGGAPNGVGGAGGSGIVIIRYKFQN